MLVTLNLNLLLHWSFFSTLKLGPLMALINTDGQFQENTEFLKKGKLVLTSFEKNNGYIGIQKQHGFLCPITLATLKKRNLKKKINHLTLLINYMIELSRGEIC